jgi:hypothetical protein
MMLGMTISFLPQDMIIIEFNSGRAKDAIANQSPHIHL